MPKDLSVEFDKVLLDILRVKTETLIYSKDYKFVGSYLPSAEFNFEFLEKYLLGYEKPIDAETIREFLLTKSGVIKT